MSISYIITVKRKIDNKPIAKFIGDMLKNIVCSEFEEILHLSNYNNNAARFDMSDLENLEAAVWNKINATYAEIFEKKLLIACAQNAEIKSELEQDILDLRDYIDTELRWILHSSATLQSRISLTVVDMIHDTDDSKNDPDAVMAYRYNALDLKSENEEPSEYPMILRMMYIAK